MVLLMLQTCGNPAAWLLLAGLSERLLPWCQSAAGAWPPQQSTPPASPTPDQPRNATQNLSLRSESEQGSTTTFPRASAVSVAGDFLGGSQATLIWRLQTDHNGKSRRQKFACISSGTSMSGAQTRTIQSPVLNLSASRKLSEQIHREGCSKGVNVVWRARSVHIRVRPPE